MLTTEPLSIIPYPVVRSLCQLDNVYECRLFGWVIAKAQSVLKLYNKDLSDINVEHAMRLTRVTIPVRYLLSSNDNNYNNIPKAFGLAEKKIIYTKGNRDYYLTVIAFPELVKESGRVYVTFAIHNDLWHALLDFSKGYRLFSMTSLLSLSSPYSMILYLLISQQKGPMSFSIATLKVLLGCDKLKSYNRGFNFFARIIDPVRAELDQKTPYSFEYTADRTGRGGQYTNIVISPRISTRYTKAQTDDGQVRLVLKLRSRIDDGVISYLADSFNLDETGLQTVEKLLPTSWTVEQILDHAGKVKAAMATKRVRNKAGYYVNSLKHL